MKQLFFQLLFSVTVLLLTGCISQKEEEYFTVVEGSVTNKYTGQPVAAVPIEVRHFISPGYMGTGGSIDSVTAAQTDAAGQYSLSFTARKTGTYQVKMTRYEDFFDVNNGSEGYGEAQPGISNRISFEVTPYKTVTLNADSNKGGKTNINFFFISWDQNPRYSGNVFQDTVKANQRIRFSQTFKVVPNRMYRFVKTTSNRYKAPNTNYYQIKDEVWTDIHRTVGYNDTTVVNFR